MEGIDQAIGKLTDSLVNNYHRTEDEANQIVTTILDNFLKQLQIDTNELLFVDFFSKYIHAMKVLCFSDFTVSQLEHIINETPMSEMDKKIAYKLFIERKTYDDIAAECDIADSKTIKNNKDKISAMLKATAAKIYKN